MTYDEALAFFGNQTKLGAACGIKQSAVSAWGKVIPPPYQFRLQVITHGALRVDPELLSDTQAA